MSGYLQVNLKKLIEQIGEAETKQILSDFSCPINPDVEDFLKNKAIEFAKQGISATHLVMASYKEEYILAGYYALANKILTVSKESIPSKSWQKRLNKFGQFNSELKRYFISSPLIGQLGKNFTYADKRLITGDELLKLALDKVIESHLIFGGKVVYLECEDKPQLLEFYSRNGFVNFGTRQLDRDEVDKTDGSYLVQMLKYF